MDFAKTQRCYKGNSDEPSHILVAPTVNWWRVSRGHAHRERGRSGANWLSRRDLEHRDGQVPAKSRKSSKRNDRPEAVVGLPETASDFRWVGVEDLSCTILINFTRLP